jgi:hypothetical protein
MVTELATYGVETAFYYTLEGKIEGRIGVTERRGRRRKQLPGKREDIVN